MAHYISIYRARDVVDSSDVEAMYARITKDWTSWKPDDGLTMHSLLGFPWTTGRPTAPRKLRIQA